MKPTKIRIFSHLSIFAIVFAVAMRAFAVDPNVEPQYQPLGGCTPDGWDTTFTSNGVNGQVNAFITDPNGNYYVGGSFTSIQGVPAAGIAKWNGTAWSALGSGINGTVYAIAISGNDIYVGGDFNSPVTGGLARNVAKWDGSTWSTLGSGLGGGTHYVKSVAVYNGEVYLGGGFTTSDGSPFSGITKWDGTAFQSAGNLIGEVKAFAQSGGLLYAGGAIGITAGAQIGIAKFDGTTWSSMGTAANTDITAISISGSNLYVVGGIFLPGVSQGAQFGKFDGTTWSIAGQFGISNMNAVAAIGNDIYIAGSFTGGFQSIAKWNGTSFVNFGTNGTGLTGGTNSSRTVTALATDGNKLLVGGNFTLAGNVGALNIASNTLGTWEAFSGTGLDSAARAIAVSGTDVYVGGSFVSAGSASARGIAKWNGTTWSELGTGVQGTVSAIAVAGNRVYAGGTFTTAGGINANRIAVWDGLNWSALGTGVSGSVTAIVARGDDVYVAGDFQSAGGITTNRIAKWNGTSWSGFTGAPIPNIVTGLALSGNDLYVSSNTTTLDNPNYLLKYDGATWTGLANGMGGHGVSSLAVLGTDVYVTGGFTTVGGISANQVAKWNGTAWSALGGGLPPGGFGLGNSKVGVSGSDIIAVGDFTVATGGPANRVARWNGTSWSPLGNGLDGTGSVVTSGGGDIFVGGNFTKAGCNISPYFARYRQTVWTGSTNSDWHTATNWGGGTVPPANTGISIGSNNVSLTTADVTVSSLIVSGGRTVTVGTRRTLTVTGNLDLSNGSLAGPGTVIVNGDLNLNQGNIAGLAELTISGNLYLNDGTIIGSGAVAMTACRASAVSGGSATSFINSPLTRCVNSSGTYRFPVGSNGVYAPLELTGIAGTGTVTVEPKTGAFAGSATGLPANRLQRWWNVASAGVTQADLTLTYNDPEIVGTEPRYKIFRISGGTAQLLPTTVNTTLNRATSLGVSAFAAFTLADGPSSLLQLQGRIQSASGKGAFGVVVSLTDQNGNTRYAMTNPFGYYRFPEVLTWENYTIRVQSKRYTFSSNTQTLLFPDNSTGVNFTATNH